MRDFSHKTASKSGLLTLPVMEVHRKLILDNSGRKSLNILGWSWGTVTSGRFAAKYPELVKKLVLYAPIVAGLGDIEVKTTFNHNTWVHAAGDFQVNSDGSINFLRNSARKPLTLYRKGKSS